MGPARAPVRDRRRTVEGAAATPATAAPVGHKVADCVPGATGLASACLRATASAASSTRVRRSSLVRAFETWVCTVRCEM